MLSLLVIWSAIFLLLYTIGAFMFGHRIRRGHWLLSLGTIVCAAGLAWALQRLLLVSVPLLWFPLAAALVVGALVAATFEDWNVIGHGTFTAVVLSAVLYVAYSGYVLFAAQLGPWSLVFGVILFFLQSGVMLLLVASTFEIVDVICRLRWSHVARECRIAGFTPKVSLHVPIHREPPEVVIETLDAIARLDYPNFEVLVIDNNTDDESLWRPVEEHCRRLGSRFRFFHLLPWPGYKSGALNYGLEQTAPDTQLVGIVDADYQVEPDWLTDLTGHFANEKVAFVQTPQDYRDIDTRGLYGKALGLSYIYFFRISMASRNERNAIIFAGTMGLVRKSALVTVGGWDEWCITEDAELSLRLLSQGHSGIYVDKTYGRGIMPMDYAGLKKQRFRWAFGGMQIMRMHADKLFNPLSPGLTSAQRWAYISGGLQWLNDPLALAFTMLLLIGSAALLAGGSLGVLPFVGAVLFVPPIFLMFSIARFLWALRVRERCTAGQAASALAVLLGLTWVVTLACLRGLVSRQGVFLRTPKQGSVARVGDTLAIVGWETALGLLCFACAVALLLREPLRIVSGQTIVIVLLLWQSTIYMSALITSTWDYRERRGKAPGRAGFRTVGYALGRLITERPMAAVVVLSVALLGQILFLAISRQPAMEKIFHADPLRQFLPVPSLLPPSRNERAAAVLIAESSAAQGGDLEGALALWHPDGEVVDQNFTPDRPEDDRVWRGKEAVRGRYLREFRERTYVSLQHLNLSIHMEGDLMVIENDLDAIILRDPLGRSERVLLRRADRWELREENGRWQIVKLTVNRTPRSAAPQQSPKD